MRIQKLCYLLFDLLCDAAGLPKREAFVYIPLSGGASRQSIVVLACRYDVLLTANASIGNYWITAQPQYRMGSPNGFAILQYEGAPPGLPLDPTPQPGSAKPWSIPQIDEVIIEQICCPAAHHENHCLFS